jgi:hypothetical protein
MIVLGNLFITRTCDFCKSPSIVLCYEMTKMDRPVVWFGDSKHTQAFNENTSWVPFVISRK